MKQFVITPACGKRLIGKALTVHPAMLDSLKSGTVVIVAGTTNGYVAEEILMRIDQAGAFVEQRVAFGSPLAARRSRYRRQKNY